MKNNVMLILLSLSLAVFGVITTEVAVIGLLPQLTEQLQITAPQVGFLVSIYAVVVAITGPAITHQYDVILFFRILPALTHAVFFAIALVVAGNCAVCGRIICTGVCVPSQAGSTRHREPSAR